MKKPTTKSPRGKIAQAEYSEGATENETAENAFKAGVDQAHYDKDEKTEAEAQIEKQITRNFELIDRAREFDKEAYRQLAIDRAYARGNSSQEITVNVIGSYIDTWCALLTARDPDVDVEPDDSMGTLPEAKEMAKTTQIVVGKLLKKARLKTQAKPWVRAGLTSHVGWAKGTWQERMGQDPVAISERNDMLRNIEAANQMRAEMEDGDCKDIDLALADYRDQLKGIEARIEVVQSKGMCLDPLDMADITVSDECVAVTRYQESPWISHRIYMRLSDAKSRYKLTEDEARMCSTFGQKAPKGRVKISAVMDNMSAEDADAFKTGDLGGQKGDVLNESVFVELQEMWNRDNNQVFTMIRGLKRYAVEPYTPVATSRFYPFFQIAMTDVDGERWPQSLNQRSQPLQDEFDRSINAFAEHRRRVKPKTMFHAGMMSAAEAKKLQKGVTGELIPIRLTGGSKIDLKTALCDVKYAPVDMALYATQPIMQNFELVWGLQEAMNGTINTAKTAREAEIQQTGSQARTVDKRDNVEEAFSDLAQYTAEIALGKLSVEDARELAGPEAVWPLEPLDIEEISALMKVEIKAGSSGKPNTVARQQSWGVVLPQLKETIMQVGQLRQSSPLEIADKLEELAKETLARTGEKLDIKAFMPQPGQPVQLIDPATMQPVLAYPAPQQPGAEGAPPPGGAPGALPPGGTPPSGQPGLDNIQPA